MNFKSRKREENGKKVLRYSIRKHHLGVASVAVASVLFFATGVTTVQADAPAPPAPPAPPTEPAPNYAGKVTLMKQWDVEYNDRKDSTRDYKTGADKLGKPEYGFRAANTFLGWSDKPSVGGKIAEGARLFSPEDTVATAFPDGLTDKSVLYGVYTSPNEKEDPTPTEGFARITALKDLMTKFTINANTVKIDTNVESEEVLPNTDLHEPKKDEGDKKRILAVSLMCIKRIIMILQK